MYLVIELQTTNGVTTVLTEVFQDRNLAEQKYHQTLAYAAVSSVEVHSVGLLDEFCQVIKNEVYSHNQEPIVE